jgi:inorganic pyrophosphatase
MVTVCAQGDMSVRLTEDAAGDTRFWLHADHLLATNTFVVDRPRESRHPSHPDFEYPLDYGYLQDTSAADGGGIDAWRGSLDEQRVTAVIITVDLLKRDVELKLLVGCTDEEANLALAAHQSSSLATLLVARPSVRAEAFSSTPDVASIYEVELVQLEPQPVAAIRAITTQSEIVSTFKILAPEIVDYLQENDVSSTGAPYVRYFHSGADRVDLEVGVMISGAFDGNSRVELGELPGGQVTTLTHTGPFEELPSAYTALVEWIQAQGRITVNSPWEVYLTYPMDDFDSTERRTQIYWPIL